MSQKVLLIDDDNVLRASLTQTLELEGFEAIPTNGFVQARRHIRANFSGVIVSDIRMPHQDGFDVLACARSADEEIPVIMLTGHSDVPTAMRAIREGAFEYLEKPIAPDRLVEVVHRALRHRTLVLKTRRAEQALRRSDAAMLNFPGHGQASGTLREALRHLAEQSCHVHLCGATGVGKRRAAFAINTMAPEPRTFLGFNANSGGEHGLRHLNIPEGPTDLSLKNVQALTLEQMNDLRAMRSQNPDLRIFMTSTETLADLSRKPVLGDLMYDLEPLEVQIPDLETRREDLPEIFNALLRQAARSLNVDMPNVPEDFLAGLVTRTWEGNLEELTRVATSIALGQEVYSSPSSNLTLAEQMDTFERMVLIETLKRTDGRAQLAADLLGLPRNTLYDRLARHNLSPKDFRTT